MSELNLSDMDQSLQSSQQQQENQEQDQINQNRQQEFYEKNSGAGFLDNQAHRQHERGFNSDDFESIKAHLPIGQQTIVRQTIRHNYKPNQNACEEDIGQEGTEQTSSGTGQPYYKERAGESADKRSVLAIEDKDDVLTDWGKEKLAENVQQREHLAKLFAENSHKRMKLQGKLPRVTHRKLQARLVENEEGDIRLKTRIVKDTHISTQKEYRKSQKKERKAQRKKNIRKDRLKRTGRLLFEDENIRDDEDMATVKMLATRTKRSTEQRLRQNVKTLKDKSYYYQRLQYGDHYEKALKKGNKRLQKDEGHIRGTNRILVEQERQAEAQRQAQMAENRRIQQRNHQRRQQLKQRTEKQIATSKKRTQNSLKKVVKKERKLIRKRSMKFISALGSIVGTLVFSLFMIVMFMMTFLSLFTHVYTGTVTQNDYYVMTSVTEYFKSLETDKKEEIIINRDKLEKEFDKQYHSYSGNHIDEYNYVLPEFGYDAGTLIAYLSAKYGTFTLDSVKEELDEIHEEMYELDYEIIEEDRGYYDDEGNYVPVYVYVCYVTLEKTELDEIVEDRLNSDELQMYNNYKISVGGQQVYGPVFHRIDWKNRITSDFGERIHPVSGERSFHDGIDIAVPTGTKLFAVVEGQVITAKYSDSAGNMVTIKTESGWEVTYMHMDSLSVSKGDTVTKGQLVGRSGNTGISTGPHLHLQVHDSSGNKINPMFIVPQNGRILSEEE